MSLLFTLAAFAVTLGILIVVHEYGHYIVARWCGVRLGGEQHPVQYEGGRDHRPADDAEGDPQHHGEMRPALDDDSAALRDFGHRPAL